MSRAVARTRVVFELNPRIIGGTEHFLLTLLGALDPEKIEPIAILFDSGPVEDLFRSCGIECVVIRYISPGADPRELVDFIRARDVHLIQSSYFCPILPLAAAQAGVPHVWRFGGHIDLVHREQSAEAKRTFLALAACLSSRVVCASQFLRQQFERIREEGIEVIHNGIDLREYGDPTYGFDPSRPTLAMLAHLVPQKRHEDFIRAAAIVSRRLPAARFVIFGAPYPSEDSRAYAESLRQLVATLDLQHIVQFHHVDRERREDLRTVGAFVLPSIEEGSSNAILEAMAMGKPVIAAQSGGNPELVDEGRTGWLVPAMDPEAIADRMMRLLTSPEMAARFGAAARQRIEERFDSRQCARKYEALYARVLAQDLQPAG